MNRTPAVSNANGFQDRLSPWTVPSRILTGESRVNWCPDGESNPGRLVESQVY